MKTRYVKLENRAILDPSLRPSTLRVYAALRSCAREGRVRSTYLALSRTSRCAVGTVRRAVQLLEQQGYLATEKQYWRPDGAEEVWRDTNVYLLKPQDFSQGYTLVPCKLLALPITHAAFSVGVYLLKLAGCGQRAWPSLRRGFQRQLGLSRTTVCTALRQLTAYRAFLRLPCRKKNRACTMSSYIPLLWGEEKTPALPLEGGSVFDKPPVKHKITSGFLPGWKRRFVKVFRKIGAAARCWTAMLRPSLKDIDGESLPF
ncbi:MAG TPA: hypothetical protein IAC31_00680 [Candidatus Faecousia intestinigallinarum]|nr:hypothetical protein [Candidatus Faecousia intestinigallinarum]